MDRRQALRTLSGLGIGTAVFHRALAAAAQEGKSLDRDAVAHAEWVAGITLNDDQRDAVAKSLADKDEGREQILQLQLDSFDTPATLFRVASDPPALAKPLVRNVPPLQADAPQRPASDEELAFLSVAELGLLLRSKQVTSLELTRLFLERLKKYDPLLHCVVNLCEATALEQAAQADAELAMGKDRGPLHGIPWGAKDLIAIPGYPTTWGAPQFREQTFDREATVSARLHDAGAVLVAKLSLGALAMGDKWFGGMTRSPWDASQGSSGSSAGSASAVAAGLVPFAIGSETLGSIVSPSRRCGTVGLRPTFGRVSRYGCMPLSWTMDKIGPIVRYAQDAALVFAAIHGADGQDRTALDAPFDWPVEVDLSQLTVGVVAATPRRDDVEPTTEPPALDNTPVTAALAQLGARLVPLELPQDFPVWPVATMLEVEAAAMFQSLTDAHDDEGLNEWAGIFRAARFVSAVEFLQALRARTRLMKQMETVMASVDLYVSETDLGITNLTGHPSIVLRTGWREREGRLPVPTTQTLTGRLFDDARLIAVAHQIEAKLNLERRRPPLDEQFAAANTPMDSE